MAENTSIEWCDHTWTPVVGCDAISPACANCYAATMAARLEAMGQEKYRGLAVRAGGKGKWTGLVKFWEPDLVKPLTVRKPGRWFLTSMGDVFHRAVAFDDIDSMFAVMALADRHTFMLLTKRPEQAALYLSDHSERELDGISRDVLVEGRAQRLWEDRMGGDASEWLAVHWPLPNVFIGCTAEDQQRADELRPHMASIAAAGWKTFVSYEPALGPVDWTGWEFLKQLISGGESGHKARPSHPDWHRGARDFAAKHGIAYLMKQWGEWLPWSQFSDSAVDDPPEQTRFDTREWEDGQWHDVGRPGYWESMDGQIDDEQCVGRVGKKAAGRLLDGRTHDEFPEVR